MNISEITLWRERIVLSSVTAPNDESLIDHAASNRLYVSFSGEAPEDSFVVRSKNMHGCIRMAAYLVKAKSEKTAPKNKNLDEIWDAINDKFEQKITKDNWCVIFRNGEIIFEAGVPPLLIDVIESCAVRTDGTEDTYEDAIMRAQNIFRETHPDKVVQYLSTIALNVNFEEDQTRCYALLRGLQSSRTFSFAVRERAPENRPDDHVPLRPSQCLSVCAAFLEGTQLVFAVKRLDEKPKSTLQDQKQRSAILERLTILGRQILSLEEMYRVTYRPEKPDFFDMIEVEA